ncbi:MAG: putative bifunctional diguanylate cyclase/phosphodiesterase [Paracoccaceae bacterium]
MATSSRHSSIAWLKRTLAERQLLAFLPLAIVAVYWSGSAWVLFVTSFLFPALIAVQEILNPRRHAENRESGLGAARNPVAGIVSRQDALEHLGLLLKSRHHKGCETAVLHVDIDNFRRVNERYGMASGDRMLQEISDRIEGCVRRRDLVARIDRDDFVVLLHPFHKMDIAVVLAIADRISEAMKHPFSVDRTTCNVTCSIGICLSRRAPRREADSMLESAGIALELARREGPGQTRSFSPKMAKRVREVRSLSAGLEAALDNGQIRPWFQPQICTDTGKIAGFEALARWEHPENGVVLPDVFLNVVENAGQSERLGEVVLYHALTALRAWDRAGLRIPSVGVNFSSTELQNPKLVEKIKWEVDRFDINPARISIEVLENVVSEHEDDVISRNIRGLSAQGFGIDLDDFGVGHAAIANIRRFAVNRIKIDRSFVTRIDTDSEQQVIASAILRMAESLGLETLAEGVETVGEYSLLAQLGCRYIQGFGVARPMPFEATIPWLAKHDEKLARGAGPARRAG